MFAGVFRTIGLVMVKSRSLPEPDKINEMN